MQNNDAEYPARLAAAADRLRADGVLGRSDQLLRLFNFLLENSLAGRAPKEIEIAHAVFGKSNEANPGQDAPVRIYAHRLRRKLEEVEISPEGGDRLVLSRGEYRLALADAGEPELADTPPATLASRLGRGRYRFRPWMGIAIAAALVIVAWAIAGAWRLQLQPTDGLAKTAFWQSMAVTQRPAIPVLGDFYVYGESDAGSKVTRLVRRFDINTPDDLEAFRVAHPAEAAHATNLNIQYLPVGVASALGYLTANIVKSSPKKIIRPAIPVSQLSPQSLREGDIVFVGHLSSLGMLHSPVFASSGFTSGASPVDLIDKKSGRRFVSEWNGDATSEPRREYAYVASLPGPYGNRVLIIAGTGDLGVMQAADVVTDIGELQRLATTVGPGSFEALYEVSALGNVNIGSKLLISRALAAPPIWRPHIEPPLRKP